jgi:hypothetical protein
MQVMREINDPASRKRWLLVRDEKHPDRPGRLIQADGEIRSQCNGVGFASFVPVIRRGDPLVVEQHSATVDARLEAVATQPAALHGEFKVRLKFGGAVLRAVAVAQGKAILLPEREKRQ